MGILNKIKKVTSPFTDAAKAAGSYIAPGSGFADDQGKRFSRAAAGFNSSYRPLGVLGSSVGSQASAISGAVKRPSLRTYAGALGVAGEYAGAFGAAPGAAAKVASAVRGVRFSEELGAKNAGRLRTAGEFAVKGKSAARTTYSSARAAGLPDLASPAKAIVESAPEVVSRAAKSASRGTNAAVDIRGVATGSIEANKARLSAVTSKIAEGGSKAAVKGPKRLLASAAGKATNAAKYAFVSPVQDVLTGASRIKGATGFAGKAKAVGTAAKHTPGLAFKMAAVTAPAVTVAYASGRETLNQIRGGGNVASATSNSDVATAFAKVKSAKGQAGIDALIAGLAGARAQQPDFSKLSDVQLQKLLRSSVKTAYSRTSKYKY